MLRRVYRNSLPKNAGPARRALHAVEMIAGGIVLVALVLGLAGTLVAALVGTVTNRPDDASQQLRTSVTTTERLDHGMTPEDYRSKYAGDALDQACGE